MKGWFRSDRPYLCRGIVHAEPREIPAGDPVFFLTLGFTRYRCSACANEPVPAEIPNRQEPAPSKLGPLPRTRDFDWKQIASGERIPGSDDE